MVSSCSAFVLPSGLERAPAFDLEPFLDVDGFFEVFDCFLVGGRVKSFCQLRVQSACHLVNSLSEGCSS